MRRSVQWARDALDDLNSQVEYIADDSPAAARRVAGRIGSAAADLGTMPTGRPGRMDGTYETVVRGLPYIIAYTISRRPSGGEVVTILRVIHGARDWPPGKWPR